MLLHTPDVFFSLYKLFSEYFKDNHTVYIGFEVKPHWLLVQGKELGGWGGIPPVFLLGKREWVLQILIGVWELKNLNMKREKV